jgi:hypothetical protein
MASNRDGPPILSQTDGAKVLVQHIHLGKPFSAGKLGTSEMNALWFYICYRNHTVKSSYPQIIMTHMTVNAGLFPATNEAVDAWADHMLKQVLPNIDIIAEWTKTDHERLILNMVAPYSTRVPLRSLEPYYEADVADRWTYNILDHSTVAVISPFAQTIKQQWNRQTELWPNTPVWPSTLTIIPIQCGYSPSLQSNQTSPNAWPIDIQTAGWGAAVHSMVGAAAGSGSTLAIVGAGCLSLPIVAGLKAKGITAIHMGGATQILFGIKGRRWLSHEIISRLFNDAWVFPCANEIPDRAGRVEGSCYW